MKNTTVSMSVKCDMIRCYKSVTSLILFAPIDAAANERPHISTPKRQVLL